MDATKEKVKKAVREYIRTFPVEYSNFQNSHREKQDKKATKFGEVQGSQDQLVRHLIDIPATLDTVLLLHLSKEEHDWLFGLGEHKGQHGGMAWFMKMFPQFNISEDF
jgi:iron-sulfur cluster repair protein YtfE (RIC family)